MRIEKVANRQLIFIVFIMLTTIDIATLPVLTSADALQDVWASVLLVLAGAVILVLPITELGARFPRETIVEISQKLLGKAAGGVVSLIILWSFLHLVSIETRIYVEMIIDSFLSETPIVYLTSVLVLAAAAAAYAGIEVIGRVADFIFPFFTFVLLASFASLVKEADFTNLQPVLARGAGPVLRGSITSIGSSAHLLTVGMLIPNLIRPRRGTASVMAGVTASVLILLLTAVFTVGVLGPEAGTRFVFPFFKAIRGIALGEFLERTEILIIFAWGLGIFIALSVFIYCGAQGAAQLFRLDNYRHLLLPMGVFWVVITIQNFENAFQIRSFFTYEIFGPYLFFLLLFPYGSLWAAYFFRKALGILPPPRQSEGKEAGRRKQGKKEGKK
ncbi:MAG TPA: endospore germination permease [Firmicutes bacterium]|nr:endospore germination permease [Bacillota bacterium]